MLWVPLGLWAMGGNIHAETSMLAPEPDWTLLDRWAGQISAMGARATVGRFLAPQGLPEDVMYWSRRGLVMLTGGNGSEDAILETGGEPVTPAQQLRYWRLPGEIPGGVDPARPLEGVRIALDPGHLGGRWAEMEQRYFQIGNDPPVREGDLNLQVALLLEPKLQTLGAEVALLRRDDRPLTSLRPEGLRAEAAVWLSRIQRDQGIDARSVSLLATFDEIDRLADRLFYQVGEIRARATALNERIRPDLVIALHFNAAGWDDPEDPALIDRNDMHVIVHGNYLPIELQYGDQRWHLAEKLVTRTRDVEIPLAESIAQALAEATALPPTRYESENALQVDEKGYVWARNLLANRIYLCPVIYCEPYVANGREAYTRIQMGAYQGTREINGVERVNIFEEYADAVAEGLADYFRENRSGTAN